MSYHSHVDEENPHHHEADKQVQISDINESSIRLGFIRKVYGIIMAQLALTVAITLLMMYTPSTVLWVASNYWIIYVDMVMIIVIEILVICVKPIGRQSPYNYICLLFFTLGFSLLVGFCSAMTDPTTVFEAAVMTLGITLALTAFAFWTKTDFTFCRGFMVIIMMTMMLFGCFMWWGALSTTYTIYCSIWAVIYGIFLVIDTQMLIGKNKYKINIDEYVFAAMIIYVDIIGLFLELLSLLGNK